MSAAYSPSRDLDLSVRTCGCNRKTESPDGVCFRCYQYRAEKRAAEHKRVMGEIHGHLARAQNISKRFLLAAGVIRGGSR